MTRPDYEEDELVRMHDVVESHFGDKAFYYPARDDDDDVNDMEDPE